MRKMLVIEYDTIPGTDEIENDRAMEDLGEILSPVILGVNRFRNLDVYVTEA